MLRNISRTFVLGLSLVMATTSAWAGPVEDQVKLLSHIFLNGQVIKTRTTDPEKMIWRYLYVTYNPEDAQETTFKRNATQIEVDDSTAGTLTAKAATDAVDDGVKYMLELAAMDDSGVHQDIAAAEKGRWKAQARAAIQTLIKSGCTLGFDARRQNEGPTPYLLIADPKARKVYGFELSPSEF